MKIKLSEIKEVLKEAFTGRDLSRVLLKHRRGIESKLMGTMGAYVQALEKAVAEMGGTAKMTSKDLENLINTTVSQFGEVPRTGKPDEKPGEEPSPFDAPSVPKFGKPGEPKPGAPKPGGAKPPGKPEFPAPPPLKSKELPGQKGGMPSMKTVAGGPKPRPGEPKADPTKAKRGEDLPDLATQMKQFKQGQRRLGTKPGVVPPKPKAEPKAATKPGALPGSKPGFLPRLSKVGKGK